MNKVALLFFVSLLFSTLGIAQEKLTKPKQRSYTTNYNGTNAAPKIDACFDEASWDLVEWTTDFTQNKLDNGAAENLNDRVTWYNNNKISFEDGVYNVDENQDGMTDYSFGDPNFSFVQYQSNFVLRWEYIPDSEIFFVW